MSAALKLQDNAYVPSKWGAEFHALTHDEALGGGSAGSGKTEVLLHEADAQIYTEHMRCLDPNHPHPLEWGESVGHCLYFRRTLKGLKNVMGRAFRYFPKLDPGVKWSATDLIWTFSSGFKFQFGHMKDPNSWELYQGNQYSLLLYDELTQFLFEQYELMMGWTRVDDPVLCKMKKTRAMSNPVLVVETGEDYEVDPFWVRERFVPRDAQDGRITYKKELTLYDGTKETHTLIYLPGKPTDNPNELFRKQNMKNLASMSKGKREALEKGNWYYIAGGFYSDLWDKKLHTCDPFPVPRTWGISRSMDWGFRTPGVVLWWAHSPDDMLYCVYEWKFQNKTAAQVAEGIATIEKRLGLWKGNRSLVNGPADTQIWEDRGTGAPTIAKQMAAKGVPWLQARKTKQVDGGRAANGRRLRERLGDPYDKTIPPRICFFRTCRYAIGTLPSILTDPDDPEAPRKQKDDHAHDAILYQAAYADRTRGAVLAERHEDEDRPRARAPKPNRLGY